MAAPPPPIDSSDDVSVRSQSGCCSSSRDMVGTPVKTVTPSLSISLRASAASQRYISTRQPPAIVTVCSTQLQPVTWNSGTGSRAVTAGAAGAGPPPPPERAVRRARAASPQVVRKIMFIRLCTTARWVSWAPLGKPVVPEV